MVNILPDKITNVKQILGNVIYLHCTFINGTFYPLQRKGIVMEKTAIELLIEYYGNPYRAGKGLGIENDQTVRTWVKQGYIPYLRGPMIEEKTEGAITAEKVWRDAAAARHH